VIAVQDGRVVAVVSVAVAVIAAVVVIAVVAVVAVAAVGGSHAVFGLLVVAAGAEVGALRCLWIVESILLAVKAGVACSC